MLLERRHCDNNTGMCTEFLAFSLWLSLTFTFLYFSLSLNSNNIFLISSYSYLYVLFLGMFLSCSNLLIPTGEEKGSGKLLHKPGWRRSRLENSVAL